MGIGFRGGFSKIGHRHFKAAEPILDKNSKKKKRIYPQMISSKYKNNKHTKCFSLNCICECNHGISTIKTEEIKN